MHELAGLGPPSVYSSPVLTLALLVTRYQVDRGGGIFAIVASLVARARTGFGDANATQDPERKKKGVFISQAKLFDSLWISQVPVVIASFVLSQFDSWSFALALGIH